VKLSLSRVWDQVRRVFDEAEALRAKQREIDSRDWREIAEEDHPDRMKIVGCRQVAEFVHEVTTESRKDGRVTRKVLVLPGSAIDPPREMPTPRTMYAGPSGPRFLTSSPTSKALRRLSAGCGEPGIPYPGNLFQKAADEIDALRDALFWCGGSPSFAPEGEAHEGWMAIVAPLMRDEKAVS
jgi:hypothetical protein